MLKPAIPPDEALRIATLAGLNILDTSPEERFDRITRIAQLALDVPIALVSLIDTDRQWVKSCQGMDATEVPRDISFCGHAILEDGVFIVDDASKDPRFSDNPLVTGAPYIRFYAGQPLKAVNGSRLGTLCVIDHKPRQLNESDMDGLRDMGAIVESELNSLNSANSKFQDNENRLRAILDNVLDGIITIDNLGTIESFNKSAEKIFGYAAQEVIGNNVRMLMPEPYHSQSDSYLNCVSTGFKKIIGIGKEVVGRRKNGVTFPINMAVSEMNLGGKQVLTGILRDITEQMENKRMKSEFISTVSHELRTPLTSIRGSLGLIAGGVWGQLPEQVNTLIDIAYKNSERLILLVNDILDMEKIEAGKMEFQSSPTELMPLLKQALESNRAYAEQFNVRYELEGDLPDVKVNLDANRLMQALANLLSNAAKFSPPGDKVIISVKGNGRNVRVAVSDHGTGIQEQFRSQIFQKFAQADSSDTRKKGGTGLGLSITKAIVDQMGGSIGFDSQPDVLTTFFVEFPVWNGVATVSLPVTVQDSAIEGCNESNGVTISKPVASLPSGQACDARPGVLHVESDIDIFRVVKTIVGDVARMDNATNLAEARCMLKNNHYDLAIIDISLPDGLGMELLPALEGASPPIPAMIFSAREVRREDMGKVKAVLVKSRTDNAQLLATIKHLIGVE